MSTEGIDLSIWTFTAACPAGSSPQACFCGLESIDLVRSGGKRSMFAVYAGQRWYSYESQPDWVPIAMASCRAPDHASWLVLAAGSRGQVWELDTVSRAENLGSIGHDFEACCATCVDGQFYVGGMGRRLFRRLAQGRWLECSAPWPDEQDGVIGFNALASHPELGLVAVGWSGEVWALKDEVWRQLDAPVSCSLNAVTVDQTGALWAVGDAGCVVRLSADDQWSVVDSGTDQNLQAVCVGDDGLWVASDFQVGQLVSEGVVWFDEADELDMETAQILVHCAGLGVISIGPYDAVVFGGDSLRRIA